MMTSEEMIERMEQEYQEGRGYMRALAACIRAARAGRKFVDKHHRGDSEPFDFAEIWHDNDALYAAAFTRLAVGEELDGYRRVE